MTSKNLFFKLLREDIKRRLWAVGLAFLVFFFSLPVAAAMGCAAVSKEIENSWTEEMLRNMGKTLEEVRLERLSELFRSVAGYGNLFVVMAMIGAGLVLGLTGFLYLHSRKQTDFYHSVPVRRETVFGVRWLNGFLIVAGMYLLNLLLALGIFQVNGFAFSGLLGTAFSAMALHLTGFLLCYGVMILAVLLTGNFFVAILGGLALSFYVPLTAYLAEGLMDLFFMTAGDGEKFGFFKIHGSPMVYYIDLYLSANQGETGILSRCGLALAAALILLALARFIHRLRPSEAAGKAIAFPVTRAPIKVLLVVPCTIALSMIFWSIYNTLGWAAFGFAAGLLISHCVIEIIYHFDFRRLFANLPQMALCAALALACIGVFRYDVIGYDAYIPEEADFSSASLEIGRFERNNVWDNMYLAVKTEDGSYDEDMMFLETYVEENMRVTDYASVRAVAEAGVASAKEEKAARMRDGDGYDWDEILGEGSYAVSINLTYRLQNGKAAERTYTVDAHAVREAFETIYRSREYKDGVYPILHMTADSVVGLYTIKAGYKREVSASDELRAQILTAYQEELADLTLAERAVATPVIALRFLTEPEYRYLCQVSHARRLNYAGDFRLDDMQWVNFYPVYPSFTRTIALLKEAGIDAEAAVQAADVERVEISSWYAYQIPESNAGEDGETTEDPAVSYFAAGEQEDGTAWTSFLSEAEYEKFLDQIEYGGFAVKLFNDGTPAGEAKLQAILDQLIPVDLADANGLQRLDTGLVVTVYRKTDDAGGEEEAAQYYLEGETAPDSVKELIHYELVEPGSGIQEGIF